MYLDLPLIVLSTAQGLRRLPCKKIILPKPFGSKGIFYAKANLLHEFGGSYNVTMTDSTGRVKVSDSFNDTWFEYGVGAAFASGKNSHVYFDVERSSGSDFTKDWQWNIGARWSF